MVHFVVCDHTLCLIVVIAARVEVACEPGKVTARDLDADAVSRFEIVTGRHGADRELVDLAIFHKDLCVIAFAIAYPLDGFTQIISPSIRVNVEQLDREVRVLDIRGDIKCDLDGPAYLYAFL